MNLHEAKVPKYQLIENDIIEKITNGTYPPGEAIPSEAELSEAYNCSRVTVRQALGNLAYKGFIFKKQGSGAFVKNTKVIQRNPFLKSFTTDMEEQGKSPSSKVHVFSVVEADKKIASLLKIRASEKIYHIERTRYADKDAILYEKTFMSVALHPKMSMEILLNSKYKYAEENGLEIEYSSQHITPIFPNDYIANELKISTRQPMLKVANTTCLRDGQIFDYTELYLHPELYQLNMIKYK